MFKTLSTLFRAQVAEAEDAIFDANATRLLEQRLREANAAFEAAKRDLALVLADQTGEERAAAALAERLAEFEAAAGSALDAGDEAQAGQLARRIAAIMDERAAHLGAAAECGGVAERLRANLERNVRLLAELKRGLATARAAAAMRRVNDHARRGAGLSDSAIQEARRTLERIRNRQAEQRDFDEAMDRVASDPDLAAPGSGWSRPPRETNPDDVLARLKRQRGQRTT